MREALLGGALVSPHAISTSGQLGWSWGAPAALRSAPQKIFWLTSIWVWKQPVLVEVLAPTRLGLRGINVRKKFRKWTTLRSKGSTLKGLLYAPIKQEQYHKDYSTQVEDPAANVARNAALSPWSVV